MGDLRRKYDRVISEMVTIFKKDPNWKKNILRRPRHVQLVSSSFSQSIANGNPQNAPNNVASKVAIFENLQASTSQQPTKIVRRSFSQNTGKMEEQLLIEDMKTMLRERYVPFLDATLRKMTIAMDGNGTPDQLTQKNIVQKYKKLLLSTRRWTINGLQTCDLQLSQLFTLATEEPNCWWQNPPHRSSPKVVPRSSSLSTANGNPPNSPKPNSRVASIIASIESRLASSTTSQQPNEDHRNVLSQNPIHNNNETCDNLNNHNRNPKRKALSKTPKFNTDTARSSPASTSQQPEGRRLSECVICVEEPVNTVLYMCGHMCMCLECATVLRERGGNCPVCRAEIQDIIRVYES